MMKIKIKRIRPEIILPTKATEGSAGYDIYSPKTVKFCYGGDVPLGFKLEIPKGYAGFLYPRSGLSVTLRNTIGVIDSDYRGEVILSLVSGNKSSMGAIFKGERIAQLIIAPVLSFEWEEVDELSETSRGTGGFGSTGKN